MRQGRFGRMSDPVASLRLVDVRVIDPSDGTDSVLDLGVRDGMIVPGDEAAGERIDGRGLVVAPGFCDLHAHLREPGDAGCETIDSGARAAAHGGFTTICAMPNTDPALDDPRLVAKLRGRAAEAACRIRFVGAATLGRAGREVAALEALAAAGVVGVSDDGAAVPTDELTRDVMRRLASLDLPLMEHAEDAALASGGVMRDGPIAARLGLRGWPAEAEVAIVERDIALVEETGARLHLTHLSTAASVDAVRAAKRRGASVTCDVTPHHVSLTDAWVAGSRRFAWDEPEDEPVEIDPARAYDGNARVNPPLATRRDAVALLAGIADGTIDAIATDHAPHPSHHKVVPFAEAAPGLIGLETALSLGLAAVEAGRLGLPTLVRALSIGPARIVGEGRGLSPGSPADLVLFDPAGRWRPELAALESGARNTPLLDRELPGVVQLTISGGRVTYRR